MDQSSHTFHCVVVAPSGKLLDCRASSAIFPAHDGQVGILANHMPMFCLLGLGIMQIKAQRDKGTEGPVYLLVDGGFAVVCQNLLKVVSYDVVAPTVTGKRVADQCLAALDKRLASAALDQPERQHLAKKVTLIKELLRICDLEYR